MRAFADADCELARTLKLKDRELDTLTNDVNEKLVERATWDPELVPNYVDLIFVARALERIGDHVTNIRRGFFLARPSCRHSPYLRAKERILADIFSAALQFRACAVAIEEPQRRRACAALPHPDSAPTRSADQLEHCSEPGHPRHSVQS
jgi:hypothetical protein